MYTVTYLYLLISSSDIYRLAAESFPVGMLGRDTYDTVLTKLLLFIQRETEASYEFSNVVEVPVDVTTMRYNCAIVIRQILREINGNRFREDILGQPFRSRLLRYSWSPLSLTQISAHVLRRSFFWRGRQIAVTI